MKRIFLGLAFWTILLLIMFILFAIAEVLAKVVTIKAIMAIVYIAMGISIVYLLKKQKGDSVLKIKNEIEIKNIDEFNELLEQLRKDVDKLKNFKFDIAINQCEHNQDTHH